MNTVETKVISSIDGRDVLPNGLKIKEVPTFGELRKLGIGLDAFQQLVTPASISNPIQFLQNWLPGFVKINTQARKIDELVGITIAGNWEDEEVVQGVLEMTGTAVPYGDYTTIPFSDFNPTFERRTVVRFEEGLRVGHEEELRAARMGVNAAQTKREASAMALDIQRNSVGFFGYNAGFNRTYGFLNDPNLPPYVTVATGGTSGSVTWTGKTFLEMNADLRTALALLRNNSGDQIDPDNTRITLAVPTAVRDRLSVTSDFGISVKNWLNETYAQVRVVSAPELNGANGGQNVFYLYAEQINDFSTDDGKTFIQVVPAKFQVLGVEKGAKWYVEDYSNATAGVICKRPYAVVRFTGI